MIEAEYKAHIIDVEAVRSRLAARARAEVVSYHDTYFDDRSRSLSASDREFRLRTIRSESGSTEHVLTFKDAAVDRATGSKPEYETDLSHREPMEQIIDRLGYTPTIAFTKKCENHRFDVAGRAVLATLVTVAELDGTFLELETMVVSGEELDSALAVLREVLESLGVLPEYLTTELYTDAVAARRGADGAPEHQPPGHAMRQ